MSTGLNDLALALVSDSFRELVDAVADLGSADVSESDILIPLPDLSAANPIEDYLVGLRLLESVANDVGVLIPGHGSDQVRARITQDRAYVHALRDGHAPDDPRISPSATFGKDWLPGVHEWQQHQLAKGHR